MKYDVVIVDTGYNLSHPKLKDKIMTGIQIVRKHKGYEILDLLDDNDDVGHGTAISNIIYTFWKLPKNFSIYNDIWIS